MTLLLRYLRLFLDDGSHGLLSPRRRLLLHLAPGFLPRPKDGQLRFELLDLEVVCCGAGHVLVVGLLQQLDLGLELGCPGVCFGHRLDVLCSLLLECRHALVEILVGGRELGLKLGDGHVVLGLGELHLAAELADMLVVPCRHLVAGRFALGDGLLQRRDGPLRLGSGELKLVLRALQFCRGRLCGTFQLDGTEIGGVLCLDFHLELCRHDIEFGSCPHNRLVKPNHFLGVRRLQAGNRRL
mmetsp:Transcript_3017/g.7200  ORF Transcript_3017/g.7200 Transcript_3017/m.7200 type:complete len:241 (-) Transcript_3017:384-1106(-)